MASPPPAPAPLHAPRRLAPRPPAMTPALPPRTILGRRRRPTLLTHLPDELLLKIIHGVLQMRPAGLLSARSIPRFRARGLPLALLSRRFLALMRAAVTAVDAGPRDHVWARALLVFARSSLTALHVAPAARADPFALGVRLADVRPPLRQLALGGGVGLPFEHVVAMLRGLPALRELHLRAPRPLDVAAVARACVGLEKITLGAVSHERDVDEMRVQFAKLMCSPAAKSLTVLHIAWSCITVEAVEKIALHCSKLEQFGAELGAMYWIRHRAFKANAALQVDLRAYAKEQRKLFKAVVEGVSANGRLRSFAVSTMDRMRVVDLDHVFGSLNGLTDFDLLIGISAKPVPMSARSFELMKNLCGASLKRINVVGLCFNAAQVAEIAREFPQVASLSVSMMKGERPSPQDLQCLGKRIQHLSIWCDWSEEMCEAVGMYNTSLESIFIVSTDMMLDSVRSVLRGTRATLTEFRMFVNEKRPENVNAVAAGEGERASGLSKAVAKRFVNDVAKAVVKECASNVEVINVSVTRWNEEWFVDCSDIVSQLQKSAPHLWKVCEVEVEGG